MSHMPVSTMRSKTLLLSHFSHVWLFETLWTVVCQAPLSMAFSRQEYWIGLPCPPPGDLPYPMIKPAPSASPARQADSLPLSHQESPNSVPVDSKWQKRHSGIPLAARSSLVAQLAKNLQCGRPRFDPWVGKIPWRRGKLPTPVFWSGEFHGLYSP